MVTGWLAIMKAIFPDSVDGDLLKLVHLSNGFKILDPRPFKVGDTCTAEAEVLSVTNSDSGKAVTVTGTVLRDRIPVIEVHSAFLHMYRGRFSDYQNTFQVTEEPEYVVEIKDAPAVGILQSQEWFEWDDDPSPCFLARSSSSRSRARSRSRTRRPSPPSMSLVPSTSVTSSRTSSPSPPSTTPTASPSLPVTAYLHRHGKVQGAAVPFDNAYTLTSDSVPSTFTTAPTNEPYSKVSGDYNPIHINPYFSDYAALLMVCGLARRLASTSRPSLLTATPSASLREFYPPLNSLPVISLFLHSATM